MAPADGRRGEPDPLAAGAGARDAAGLDAAAVATIHAGMGIAGMSRPGVRDGLGALAFPFASVAFDTDAVIANIGAHGGRAGGRA